MKPKHYSLAIMTLAVSVMALTAWYGLFHHRPDHGRSGSGTVEPLSELKVPDKSALEQMDTLERSMHLLSSPPPRIRKNVDLSTLGYIPVSPVRSSPDGDGVNRALASNQKITMAFEGQANSYCIIDSKLYPEGAVLPNGATIVKIESRRVLIAKENLQQWLTVDPLMDATMSEKRS